MTMQSFWEAINATLAQLCECKSVDEVLALCPQIPGTSSGDGFWEGDYDDFRAALSDAGWRTIWAEASYYWVKQAPDGSKITYIEGDLYRGDTVNR